MEFEKFKIIYKIEEEDEEEDDENEEKEAEKKEESENKKESANYGDFPLIILGKEFVKRNRNKGKLAIDSLTLSMEILSLSIYPYFTGSSKVELNKLLIKNIP